MSSSAREWSFLTVLSIFLSARVDAQSGGAPKTGTPYRNPYTEVNYKLTCGIPGQKNCGDYTPSNGCKSVNCFPYLEYNNKYGIAVDINGGMELVFDYCFKSTENCVPANLGKFSKIDLTDCQKLSHISLLI